MQPRVTRRTGVSAWCVAALGLVAVGAAPALAKPREYQSYGEFRYVGGVPGNTWAVTADGDVGIQGAMSQCIPIGYTPSRWNWALSANAGRLKGADHVWAPGIIRGKDVNGAVSAAVGIGPAGHGVGLVWDAVSRVPGHVINVQGQVFRETKTRPGVSVGVVNLFNRLERPGERSSRSFYVAATKKLGAGSHPLYVTAGVGSRRYNDGPFCGASYDVTRRVKVMGEYDGYAFNLGVAADLIGHRAAEKDALVFFLGAASMNRPVIALTYTR